ncbi:Polymeric immunoglobulin receptor [Labeo rohita]|nr:Polymeric immunoglobulin receptor [Labeo rohita]
MCKSFSHSCFRRNKESKWHDFFGSGSSPKGCWRTLYKPPIEKRSGDLQWRIVHGLIATNRYRAHIDLQRRSLNKRRMKIIWTFTLLMIPGVVSSISVTGYSGGGVIITCRYDKNYTANAKYFCKGQKPNILQNKRCSDLIKTEEKEKWVYEGRFSLYDDTSAAVFIVTIRDLSEQDSGTYQCASDISLSKDSYTEVKLNVITGQKISTVTGYSGGNIIINYKYDNKPKEPLINICKSGADQCFKPTSTNRAAEWKHDGRFTIHDGSSAGFLRFFIKELNVNDSAEYKIMVKDSEDHRFFSKLNLNIEDADCCEKSISLSAAAGGSVNISCKYPQSHRAHVKFVCRRSGSDLCAEETSVKENRRWSAEGQIQLYDDREQQLLTGTISHVTQQHSAEYWCGVQSDQGHKSFITRVLINVTGMGVFLTDFNNSLAYIQQITVYSKNNFTNNIITIIITIIIIITINICLFIFIISQKFTDHRSFQINSSRC